MKQEELDKILELHKLWLNSKGKKGKRANFEGANLEGADLRNSDLRLADLKRANLEGADLEGANLKYSNLWTANLEGANLEGANLDQVLIENKPTPFILDNQLILELYYSYEEQKKEGFSWNYIKKWTKLNKFTKELFD